jgi:peptide deformylase
MKQPLTILIHPTPSLHERSAEVDPKTIGTPEFQAYLDVLTETMYSADGIGLAAPQVGRNERIIVVNTGGKGVAFINPEIIKRSDAMIQSEEGCLSVPKKWGVVERNKKVTIKALDRHNRVVEFERKGLDAIIFQHEIDHLDGILFIDKINTKESVKSIKSESL